MITIQWRIWKSQRPTLPLPSYLPWTPIRKESQQGLTRKYQQRQPIEMNVHSVDHGIQKLPVSIAQREGYELIIDGGPAVNLMNETVAIELGLSIKTSYPTVLAIAKGQKTVPVRKVKDVNAKVRLAEYKATFELLRGLDYDGLLGWHGHRMQMP